MIAKRTGVLVAGALVNFCLGIFYAWSVFADGLIKELGWAKSTAMLPYTIELLTYAVAMIFAGWFQDRYGPRKGVMVSGILVGLSLILCGLTATPAGVALSFGVIFGTASAFGYSSVTPAMIRWYPPEKRGLVTGIVLMSLGSSALVWSPLVNYLIFAFGVINAFLICGGLLFLIVNTAARFIDVPEGEMEYRKQTAQNSINIKGAWRLSFSRPEFRIIWLMIGLSSGVSIMFIGQLVQIAELNYQVSWGFILVSVFAGTNALGRLLGGIFCDRLGYMNNLKIGIAMMVLSMLLYLSGIGHGVLVLATFLLGLSYGSLFTSYPLIISSIFGLANFGLIYGVSFTSLGLIGGLSPLLSAFLAQLSNSYYPTFIIGLLASLVCFYLLSIFKRKTTA
ncbi:MAG: OFA family MFS transporter [Firmicutes bacterium]|nr:OFA family MFS transporter [Bacillota bacterium]